MVDFSYRLSRVESIGAGGVRSKKKEKKGISVDIVLKEIVSA